ncbi:hypothetical protein B0H16DRAFT_1466052 [Mycena metata]|uniref:Uncharacterized protein n=1 Tax=Mycena metata TaxID=1033252 RepID=A0AAD7MYE5_9AGAR|nr:hypothetical protein B0H16DRAFT_1466052 [Mycena metata]
MCSKPRERGAAHIKRCVLSSEREAACGVHIKRCTRCEAVRLREQRNNGRESARDLHATRTSRDVRGARLGEQRNDVHIERCAQFTPSEREAARAAARERKERPAHDAHIERYTRSHPARERPQEQQRESAERGLHATRTLRDVRGARLREQRNDVHIERCAQFTPSEREAARAAARERREGERLHATCTSRDVTPSERERLHAMRTSRDVRGAGLQEQRHDVHIERCAHFTPNKRERLREQRRESAERGDAHVETRRVRYAESERPRARRTSKDMHALHTRREREAARAAAREAAKPASKDASEGHRGDACVETRHVRCTEREG